MGQAPLFFHGAEAGLFKALLGYGYQQGIGRAALQRPVEQVSRCGKGAVAAQDLQRGVQLPEPVALPVGQGQQIVLQS
ncbi:hypothetical protein ADICEAN_04213 [Cesiribacter andamanensis AMV16]|uniref:Uncharacterized protein n=1 Tax=Cesiribacter andamanensis AMV16 TaxID=1279009 RepID=M7N0B3_9BACT|nr:hypothetical protein ADICEAN_04213 [Cesiribacter andamanensis AMV16]